MNETQNASPGAFVVYGHMDSSSFSPTYREPHLPVLAAFGHGPMHRFSMAGRWDLERAMTDNEGSLIRSVCHTNPKNQRCWDDLTFQFGAGSILHASADSLNGFASTAKEAEAVVKNFAGKYLLPPDGEGGACYSVIRLGREIERGDASLELGSMLSDETLALHYGEDVLQWQGDLIQRLNIRKHGIALLEGPQGTGKKSYLRHLIGVLRESHRFYFIPSRVLRVLSHPCFIDFWVEQRYRHKNKLFALIIEDSDALLTTNDAADRESINTLHYLTEGLLANFLRLQIFYTINVRSTDIDQALLHPGRLIAHRIFKRLGREHAARLAQHLGRSLPHAQDYSLAEIFADPEACEDHRTRIGFAA